MRVHGPIAEEYEEFAAYAVDSPCFRDWALAVAADPEVLAWLSTLPAPRQQPNLVFAAARWHGLPAPGPYDALRTMLLSDRGAVRSTILSRATQTNEAGRMATLLPAIALAAAGRPVALLEAGASAGLCLYPDRWTHRWVTESGVRTAPGRDAGAPVLTCEVSGPAPLPGAVPDVRWRGGIDLNPLDVTSDDDAAWLLNLVWPEHHDRRALLAAALEVARADPPDIRRGDLLDLLPGRVEEARAAVGPEGAVVVIHTAVILYLDDQGRRRFADLMAGLVGAGACHWVSNEAPGVLPSVTATGPRVPSGRFVLGLDGRSVGHTQPHGRSLAWWADLA